MSTSEPDRLRRVEELLDAALERPPSERIDFLEKAAPHDPSLRREVESLLRSHLPAAAYFDDLADDVAEAVARELMVASGVDRTFGPYRALARIGAGGMGTVFLAERADGQFERTVALKLIRRGLESEDAVERFLAERQILAQLDHPSIAGLLDGGVTVDGLPYYVMEYVEGEPLDEYCDARRLGVEERLRLFVEVADTVQFLHRHLVVHRDLKPANILVTATGQVKLLDFGIARLLSDGDAHWTRGRALTRQYAAPEQILGEPVTTEADVFALGVVLYELLVGCRPFARPDGSLPELERAVLDEEAEPPSARVAGGTEAPDAEAVAHGGDTSPRRLVRRLRGDLDHICIAALRKEPAQRYRSAEQLAEDVRRHLRRLPIVARRNTAPYRARKFLRRHAVGASVTATAIALLLGFGLFTLRQADRVARERDRAERVSDLLVDVFKVADPSEAGGEGPSAREVLDRGAARLDRDLQDHPETRAELLSVIGEVYRNLGLYDAAGSRIEASLELRREVAGGGPDVAHGLILLGDVRRLQGRYEEADSLLRRALEMERERERRPDRLAAARALDRLGLVRLTRGEIDEAEAMFREALVLNREARDEGEEIAGNLANLAAVALTRGEYGEAVSGFSQSLELRRDRLGAGHPDVAATLSNLAAALARNGAFAEAEEAQSEALELYRELLGDEHPRMATMLNNVGLLRISHGDPAGAEAPLRRSLEMRRSLLDPEHPEIAQSLANLGLVLTRLSRYDEARTLYREALAIRRRALGPDHPQVAQVLHNLGLLHQSRGDYETAERRLREAMEMLRGALGETHPLVATSLNDLAALLHERGDLGEAERHYRAALEVRRSALPPDHLYTAHTLAGLGTVLLDREDAAGAEPLLREAREIRAGALPADHPQVAEVESKLALAVRALGRRD